MCLGGCVRSFDGVSFEVSCIFSLAIGLQLFDLFIALSINRDGEATNLVPQIHVNLFQFAPNTGGVRDCCLVVDQVSLVGVKINIEKVKQFSCIIGNGSLHRVLKKKTVV